MVDHTTELDIVWWTKEYNSQVLDIERLTQSYPLTEKDFYHHFKDRDTIGMVAVKESVVLAYTVYELYKKSINILRLTVHPQWRGQGVGRKMLFKLTQNLSPAYRSQIIVNVRERNLMGQKWLSYMRFKAVWVEKNWFLDSNEDNFTFILRFNDAKALFSSEK